MALATPGAAAAGVTVAGAAAAGAPVPPALLFSLGTGAQPLAVFAQRERPPVPLDRARVAVVGDEAAQPVALAAGAGVGATTGAASQSAVNTVANPSVNKSANPSANTGTSPAADHLHRHHPAAQALPQPAVLAALRVVAQAQPQADLALLPLLPALQALQQHAVPGLELRQVLPGAAGHHHLVLRAQHAALMPALNKLIIGQRSGGNAAHQAVLRYAQNAAPALRAPLALPADGPALAAEVMAAVLKVPFTLKLNAVERQALAERPRWRVGMVGGVPASLPGADVHGAAALLHIDAQGRAAGVAADTVQEVAQRLGVLIDWLPFDNEAALLDALRAGRIDTLPLLQHTPEHARTLVFSLPWLELPHVLVGRAQGPLYWGLGSLRGLRLALPAPTAAQGLRGEIQRLYPRRATGGRR